MALRLFADGRYGVFSTTDRAVGIGAFIVSRG
jgi:hypothetical protein